MLVLSRREGESVCVGDGVVVTVVRICGNKVRVGVAADKTTILRSELRDKDAGAVERGEEEGGADTTTPDRNGEKDPVAA